MKYNLISLLHIITDNRIWPDFLYSSPNDYIKEEILIGSMEIDENYNIDLGRKYDMGIGIDKSVTVVNYKAKTVQSVLTEIAGMLVLTTVLSFFLSMLNEWSFNRKMSKESNQDYREVFTYPNFKKTMDENQEMKA